MANIQILSTSVIRAPTNDGDEKKRKTKERINLTPWDLQLLRVHAIQKGLIFNKPNQKFNYVEHLKSSLSRTLAFFPPLAGRLNMIENDDGDATCRFFIDCDNSGARFVHAVANGVSVADTTETEYVPIEITRSFFLLNGVENHEGVREPLLAVQVTELVDGIFIGCTVNHSVVDGTSFWHFVNSWAEISRTSSQFQTGSIPNPPALHRWFPDGIEPPIRIPIIPTDDNKDSVTPQPLRERVFHFRRESVATLKSKANAEAGTNKISSLQALLAHFWRSVIRSQYANSMVEPDQETHYKLLIGARSRVKGFPEHYFGNAIQVGALTLKAKQLIDNELGFVAWKMNRMVAEHTEDEMKDYFKRWVENPKLPTLSDAATNALITSSSPRFDVYGNDFGWGKPIAIRSGEANKSLGKITLFEGIEQGSIDIEACLSLNVLETVAKDKEFMDSVTIKSKPN
ncbi:uncharacterized acetyltransferase At3g50280-like [Rutidosis leptorrhynchoides]|uniref:uncharacterized acetyltransferase At3g50280-like n=1 Tax=Rutidosis leptorrhynchoides TaxID=125765 RepID=UPI003A995C20